MSGVLGIVGGTAVLWLLLVGTVRLLQPWLSRVLPHSVRVSASWYCISVHSERVPSFLRSPRCAAPATSPPPAATTPSVAELFGDTVVDLLDTASSAVSTVSDDDSDDDDTAVFAADAQRATQQRPARRGCRARVLHIVYRLWRLFGLSARGWNKFYSVGAVVACTLGVLVLVFIFVNPAVALAYLSRMLRAAHSPAAAAAAAPTLSAPLVTDTATATATAAAAAAGAAPTLQPVVPGLTFPLNRALLMVAAVALCGVFHELGHAFAAVVQGYALQAVGVELYLLVVPKFYADIDGAVQGAPAAQSLRVFCAGVWHNLVMGAAALALTAVLSTAFLDALYTPSAQGPVVTGIPPASPMAAARLALGDALVRVGTCPVSSAADWDACLTRLSHAQQAHTLPQGFCVPGTRARRPSHLWNDSELDAMLSRLLLFFKPLLLSRLSHPPFFCLFLVHPAWKEQRGSPTIAQCCKSGYNGYGQCFAVTVSSLLALLLSPHPTFLSLVFAPSRFVAQQDRSPVETSQSASNSSKQFCLEPYAVVAHSAGRCSAHGSECSAANSSGVCVVPVLPQGQLFVDLTFLPQGSSDPLTVIYAGTLANLWNSRL